MFPVRMELSYLNIKEQKDLDVKKRKIFMTVTQIFVRP